MRDNQDDFLPFLASVDGEDMPGATDDGLMTPDQFKEYCHRVESTAEWGGEPEVSAAESSIQCSTGGHVRQGTLRSISRQNPFCSTSHLAGIF